MSKHSNATAVWKGDLKSGIGMMSAASGAFKSVSYTFKTRFEDAPGTNPEELIAAAHAACFSMAFSGELNKAGITPESIETTATTTLEPIEGKQTVTEVHLDSKVTAPGADEAAIQTAGDNAKAGCPISRLLNAKVTLNVSVV